MAANRTEATRRVRRALRPIVGDALESRALMSGLLGSSVWVRGAGTAAEVSAQSGSNRAVSAATRNVSPAGNWAQNQATRALLRSQPIKVLVAAGGQVARVIDNQGEVFDIRVIGTGTVSAAGMGNGTVKITAAGTTPATELVIYPVRPRPGLHPNANKSHTFIPGFGKGDEILRVGQIDILSGRIGQINGYRTVDLYGRINVLDSYANPSDAPNVSRISLNAILPGGSIHVAGDLDTLDVFTSAELIGEGSGIFVGRDLNWAYIQGDLKLGDGGQVLTGRDVGLVGQPAKGTSIGGQGMLINGNFLIDAESSFEVGRTFAGTLFVRGDLVGTSRFIIGDSFSGGVVVQGLVVSEPATNVVPTIPPPV